MGNIIGAYYKRLEFSMLKRSDHVVIITEDFMPILDQANIKKEKIHLIHNWAPLEELPLQPKDNDWAREHGLHDKLCFLYSGTLGLKHNPKLILKLAIQFTKPGMMSKLSSSPKGLGRISSELKKTNSSWIIFCYWDSNLCVVTPDSWRGGHSHGDSGEGCRHLLGAVENSNLPLCRPAFVAGRSCQ